MNKIVLDKCTMKSQNIGKFRSYGVFIEYHSRPLQHYIVWILLLIILQFIVIFSMLLLNVPIVWLLDKEIFKDKL